MEENIGDIMQVPSSSSYDEVAEVHFQSILASSQNYCVQISEPS